MTETFTFADWYARMGYHRHGGREDGTMIYIQRRGSNGLETVDQFETHNAMEAINCLREYRISDSSAHYYLSTRPCKAWLE